MSLGHPASREVRQAIIRAFHEQGFTYQQIAEFLDIGIATVNRTLRLYRETGQLEPKPKGGGRLSPIRGEIARELKKLVAEHPDFTVAEYMAKLVEKTGVRTSLPSMKRAMHRLGFTHKKRSSSRSSGTLRRTSGAVALSRRS